MDIVFSNVLFTTKLLAKDTLPALLKNSLFSIYVCTFPTNSSLLRPFNRLALLWDRHYHEYDFLSNIINGHVWAIRVFICLTSSILFAISGVTISATPDFPVVSPFAIHNNYAIEAFCSTGYSFCIAATLVLVQSICG